MINSLRVRRSHRLTSRSLAGLLLLVGLWSHAAQAVVVSPELEALLIPDVGNDWQTISVQNTYANPVVTCTYNLPSAADNPALTRIRNAGPNSFELRIQNPTLNGAAGTVTPSDVHCLVAETGAHTLPDGRNFEAGTTLSTATGGIDGTGDDFAQDTETVTVTNTYTSPVVLGQVMTFNDPDFSVFYSHACSATTSVDPYNGGDLCIGKHTGQSNEDRADETLGYIIFEGGTGTLDGELGYSVARGGDTIGGVDNGGGASYNLNATYEIGVATEEALDGPDGGWAVLFGADPLAGSQIDLAIDEENASDNERSHTTEQVGYFVLRDLTPSSAVDDFAITSVDVDATFSLIANDTGISAASLRFPNQSAGTVSNGGLTLTVAGEGVYTLDTGSGEVTFDPEPDFTGQTTPVIYQGDQGLPASQATIRIVINERSLCTADGTVEPYVMGNPNGTNSLVVFQVDDGSGTQTSASQEELDHNASAPGDGVGDVDLINSFGLDTARNFAFYQDNSQTESPETLFMYDADNDTIYEIIGPNAPAGFADFSSIGIDACGTELGGAAGEYFGGAYYFGIEEDQDCGGDEGTDPESDGEIYDRIYRVDMDFSVFPPRPAGDAKLLWRFDPANSGGIGSGVSHDWGDILISPEDPDGNPGSGDERLVLIDFDRNRSAGGTDFITRINVTDPDNPFLIEANVGNVDEVGQGAIAFDGTVYTFLASGDDLGVYDVVGAAFDGDGIGIQQGTQIREIQGPDWPDGEQAIDGSSCVDPTGSLPVTLGHFESRESGGSLRLKWQTLTETFTVGFNAWAQVNGEWVQLNDALILTRTLDSVVPRTYRTVVSVGDLDGEYTALALTSVDLNGHEEGFGPFEPGERYGIETSFEPIPWNEIGAAYDARMRERGYVYASNRWVRSTDPTAVEQASLAADAEVLAHVGVLEDGVVQVSYNELLAAGVDLAGVSESDLAITWKGNPVPREVAGPGDTIGARSVIRFYGEAPKGSDALYIAENRYQISRDVTRALPVEVVRRRPDAPSVQYDATVVLEEDNAYSNILPTGDPFHMGILVAGANGATWPAQNQPALTIGVASDIDTDLPAEITLNIAAISNPDGQDTTPADGEIDPDHAIAVLVNGVEATLENSTFEGYGAWLVRGSLAPGVLQPGDNSIRIQILPTGYSQFSIKALDDVTLRYPRPATADSNQVTMPFGPTTGDGYSIAGYTTRKLVGYGFSPSSDALPGNLVKLKVRTTSDNGGYLATIPVLGDDSARYVVSARNALGDVASIESASPAAGLLNQQGDFLLIVHPSFLPSGQSGAETHPLDRFVVAREVEGYSPVLVNLEDVVAEFGFGMQTPDAITNYLRAANQTFDYDHVLLVGGDVYDYLDKLGNGAISFIPTRYAVTAERLQYTPTDALMVDFDDDELSDKALGRWPVRTMAELETVVDKTLAFGDSATGLYDQKRALLIAEEITPQEGFDFSAQMDRLEQVLVSVPAGGGDAIDWAATADAVDKVYVQEIYDDPLISSGLAEARQQIRDRINEPDGQTLTIFGGHGSPATWSFSNLLSAGDVGSDLTNTSTPTLMMPMACYTTYYNEPHVNTLAHQLLLGGDQGAVGIHAAATLSGYLDNERMGRASLRGQLQENLTLGQAIEQARQQTRNRDVRINWTLLGDPTIRVE